MKAKIIAIFVMTLLITTAISAIGVTIEKIEKIEPSESKNGGVDQEQTEHCGYGMIISPPYMTSQSFKPSVEELKGVQLYLFKYSNPPAGVEITVSIRDALDGVDLTSKTINADDENIKASGTWVFFNFDDITVIPEETYYINCYANGGGATSNCYCWLFDNDSAYTRGEAWWSDDNGVTWITLFEWSGFDPEWEESDYCFKTYYQVSRTKEIQTLFLKILQRFPNAFPILRQLLGLLN